MSVGKTFFCCLLLYGCVTVCAADELVSSAPQEEKKFSLNVVNRGAARASSRRHSYSSPLRPPGRLLSRRLSLPNLTPLEEPASDSRSVVVKAAQLHEISFQAYAREGKLAMVPMILGEQISGEVGYLTHSKNIIKSSHRKHTRGNILFIPISKIGSQMYWLVIPVKFQESSQDKYDATIWVSGTKLPALELEDSDKEVLMLNELSLRRVGLRLTFSPRGLDLFLKRYE